MLNELLSLDGWSIQDQSEGSYVLSAPDGKFYVLLAEGFLWENEPALVVVKNFQSYTCWKESNCAWYESESPVKICDVM